MFKKLNQKILKYKYKKAKEIYIVGLWARWGVLPAKYYKIDKEGNPLTIYYTDCNGEWELYYIHEWYKETTGVTVAYFFNREQAESLARILNNKDER